jgi:hypothetical protein
MRNRLENISIGELYFDSSYFIDEGSETMWKPITSSEVVMNRRKVKGQLTEKGQEIISKILEKLRTQLKCKNIILKWDIYCGCSMCPCSPGFRVIMENKDGTLPSSRASRRFNVWVNKDGTFKFIQPSESYHYSSEYLSGLQKTFTN